MGVDKFGFEMEEGRVVWTYPAHAPDVTDDQARTVVFALLVGAIERLAEAVQQLADRRTED